jgi:hypothetical protein
MFVILALATERASRRIWIKLRRRHRASVDCFGAGDAVEAPRPQMAEGYTLSDDGRTYLIRLREGLS